MTRARLLCGLLSLAAASTARGQTMLDQELRLVELHSLLVALPAINAPGALLPGELDLGLELITIPTINGQTGSKQQITASDRTPIFPRLRVALGLPAPKDFRALVGFGYIPPIRIREVSSHFGALEAELAYVPGPFSIGLRGHLLAAHSSSPVTDPQTRDTLDTIEYGASLAGGYQLDFALGSVTPYASVGLTRVAGDFQVTSDGAVIATRTVNPSASAGVRLFAKQRIELVAELVAFPGRMIHPSFRIGWVPEWFSK